MTESPTGERLILETTCYPRPASPTEFPYVQPRTHSTLRALEKGHWDLRS